MRRFLIVNLLLLGATSTVGTAAVTEYTYSPAWQAAAGVNSTITFTELPVNTLVTTQYSPLGVTFTDGSDYTMFTESFVNDQHGLNGAFDNIWLSFSQPMRSIAVDYPGIVKFYLYLQGQLLYESSDFFASGPAGTGGFAGLVSDQNFDQVRITDPTDGVFIDDLHFGPPIPAPSVLALLGVAGLMRRHGRMR